MDSLIGDGKRAVDVVHGNRMISGMCREGEAAGIQKTSPAGCWDSLWDLSGAAILWHIRITSLFTAENTTGNIFIPQRKPDL